MENTGVISSGEPKYQDELHEPSAGAGVWEKEREWVDESKINHGVALSNSLTASAICKWPRTRVIAEKRVVQDRMMCFSCDESWFMDHCRNYRKRVDCRFSIRHGDFYVERRLRHEDISIKTIGQYHSSYLRNCATCVHPISKVAVTMCDGFPAPK